MKFLGSGMFTKAFLNDKNEVILKSRDSIKEAMCLGWFPESKLFPKIEHVENADENGFSTYKMKYYPRVKLSELKPKELKKYNTLRKMFKSITYSDYKNTYSTLVEVFKTIKNRTLKNHLLDALSACSNYGSDVCFEISKRNIAIDNGNLVLLDCFFLSSNL